MAPRTAAVVRAATAWLIFCSMVAMAVAGPAEAQTLNPIDLGPAGVAEYDTITEALAAGAILMPIAIGLTEDVAIAAALAKIGGTASLGFTTQQRANMCISEMKALGNWPDYPLWGQDTYGKHMCAPSLMLAELVNPSTVQQQPWGKSFCANVFAEVYQDNAQVANNGTVTYTYYDPSNPAGWSYIALAGMGYTFADVAALNNAVNTACPAAWRPWFTGTGPKPNPVSPSPTAPEQVAGSNPLEEWAMPSSGSCPGIANLVSGGPGMSVNHQGGPCPVGVGRIVTEDGGAVLIQSPSFLNARTCDSCQGWQTYTAEFAFQAAAQNGQVMRIGNMWDLADTGVVSIVNGQLLYRHWYYGNVSNSPHIVDTEVYCPSSVTPGDNGIHRVVINRQAGVGDKVWVDGTFCGAHTSVAPTAYQWNGWNITNQVEAFGDWQNGPSLQGNVGSIVIWNGQLLSYDQTHQARGFGAAIPGSTCPTGSTLGTAGGQGGVCIPDYALNPATSTTPGVTQAPAAVPGTEATGPSSNNDFLHLGDRIVTELGNVGNQVVSGIAGPLNQTLNWVGDVLQKGFGSVGSLLSAVVSGVSQVVDAVQAIPQAIMTGLSRVFAPNQVQLQADATQLRTSFDQSGVSAPVTLATSVGGALTRFAGNVDGGPQDCHGPGLDVSWAGGFGSGWSGTAYPFSVCPDSPMNQAIAQAFKVAMAAIVLLSTGWLCVVIVSAGLGNVLPSSGGES